jgi:hypothetical protein
MRTLKLNTTYILVEISTNALFTSFQGMNHLHIKATSDDAEGAEVWDVMFTPQMIEHYVMHRNISCLRARGSVRTEESSPRTGWILFDPITGEGRLRLGEQSPPCTTTLEWGDRGNEPAMLLLDQALSS